MLHTGVCKNIRDFFVIVEEKTSIAEAADMLRLMLLGLVCLVPDITSSFPTSAPKVDVTLYYESLCPDCQLFIRQQLYPTYLKIGDIFNLTLVPYGNAEETKRGDKWVFQCQHGPNECLGNLIETCAISLLKNISVSFPFVHCFEVSIEHSGDPKSVAQHCAKSSEIDYTPIEACVNGPQGNELEHEMAKKTDALEPQHEYVPWVTINGKHTEKIQTEAENNLLKLVCDYYEGTKPAACEKQKIGRCYNNWEPFPEIQEI